MVSTRFFRSPVENSVSSFCSGGTWFDYSVNPWTVNYGTLPHLQCRQRAPEWREWKWRVESLRDAAGFTREPWTTNAICNDLKTSPWRLVSKTSMAPWWKIPFQLPFWGHPPFWDSPKTMFGCHFFYLWLSFPGCKNRDFRQAISGHPQGGILHYKLDYKPNVVKTMS